MTRCWCAAKTVSSSVRLRRALSLAAARAAVEEEAMAKTSATAAKEGMDGAADGAVEEGAATTVMTAATKREAVQEGVR